MQRILFKGGTLCDPATGLFQVGDLLIEEGRIQALGENLKADSAQVVELKPQYILCPGFVDVHTHLREPGQEHKETIETGSMAGAAGGFTTLLCMPNTTPPIDNAAIVALVRQKARQAGKSRVLPLGSATVGMGEDQLAEMADMKEAGCVGFTDDAFPIQKAETMRRAMEYCGMLGVPFVAHCEDKSLTEGGSMNEGVVSAKLGLKGMPSVAEEIAVARNLLLAEYTGCHLHIAHISTAGSVELLRWAKARGIRVTGEACPHHFSLTETAVESYDTNTKMNPPLRTERDVQAIKEGLADGTIDCIATDHAPHAQEEKDVEYPLAPFGIIGLETALGLVLRELVDPGFLSLPEALKKMTWNPARIFGLPYGRLQVGGPADLVVFDPSAEWVVDREKLFSRSKNTPFHGWKLKGLPLLTLVEGRIVYDSGRLSAKM
jgi:dihydroorotase